MHKFNNVITMGCRLNSWESNKINNVALVNNVESEYLKKDLPNIRIGDTVRLGVEIKEGSKTDEPAKLINFEVLKTLCFSK